MKFEVVIEKMEIVVPDYFSEKDRQIRNWFWRDKLWDLDNTFPDNRFKTSRVLSPGEKLVCVAYGHREEMPVSLKECTDFLDSMGAVYPGAPGMLLVFGPYSGHFAKFTDYLSFQQEENGDFSVEAPLVRNLECGRAIRIRRVGGGVYSLTHPTEASAFLGFFEV